MKGLDTTNIPAQIDGPALTAAAAALMLIPENASRLVRLHRLAALGMSLPDKSRPAMSPSAIRAFLKRDDFAHASVLSLEDPYSEMLIRSISYPGGPYLASSGTGERTIADIENLLDAIFREPWMPDDVFRPIRQLIGGLLTVSDIVLTRAGLSRGAIPGRHPGTPIDVPGAPRLQLLTNAVFLSHQELGTKSEWLTRVIDTFAIDPGHLDEPCASDFMDDRLYITPFLRLTDGYLVVAPLDLLNTLRYHLLRIAAQAGLLEELGKRWRQAVLARIMRLLPKGTKAKLIDEQASLNRYLIPIDDHHDLHLILATDPFSEWDIEQVWGYYDTSDALDRIQDLVTPETRAQYSNADGLMHLIIVDSPGRSAFWGVPNIEGIDPTLIARADDLEAILHQEPDGLLGLLLFAQAVQRRPGSTLNSAILDEYCSYSDDKKSFYMSDEAPPTHMIFQPGDGYFPRSTHVTETDRHGVVSPGADSYIIQAERLYPKDAPEIFHTVPNSSFFGFVLEFDDCVIYLSADESVLETSRADLTASLMECVAYWIRECSRARAVSHEADTAQVVVKLEDPAAWTHASTLGPQPTPAVTVIVSGGIMTIELGTNFIALLQQATNSAERELVAAILSELFHVTPDELPGMLDVVAPAGAKRMLNTFNQNVTPDMIPNALPRPLLGHEQVAAQVLDELGDWLRAPDGGGFATGTFAGQERVHVLNAAVQHLFDRLRLQVDMFSPTTLVDYLVAQNESLLFAAKTDAMMLASRLACFGEHSETVVELVENRRRSISAQRANRFLIEYAAAQPPTGDRVVTSLEYYRLLELAKEIVDRGNASDLLNYKLADFEISILESGRLGQSRDQPVVMAMDTYLENATRRSIHQALSDDEHAEENSFDVVAFIDSSAAAMRAEFGFSLSELREVCGGLLDKTDTAVVTRIDREAAIRGIARDRAMPEEVVSSVISAITLESRSTFLSIGKDAYPWRFNRDMSYVRRPLVLQGSDLIFGLRSVLNLGPYWLDNLLSGRLHGRAKTLEMQQCISNVRGSINLAFARSVSTRM